MAMAASWNFPGHNEFHMKTVCMREASGWERLLVLQYHCRFSKSVYCTTALAQWRSVLVQSGVLYCVVSRWGVW
jgi:hypothetical protein